MSGNERWVVLAFACCQLSIAFAQEKLPKEMVGTGVASAMRGGQLEWSITIDSQEPDGTLKGKLSWGGRACRLVDRPFTGTYRDGVLEISADSQQSTCGILKASLKRASTAEATFEGSANGDQAQGPGAAVTLKAR